MGWFFSNFHIKKTAELDADTFQSVLTEVLNTQGYRLADHSDEADLSVSIYDADGAWLSVCSDGLDFYTEESVQRICNPLSDRFSTDVVTVSCFDSDCLGADLFPILLSGKPRSAKNTFLPRTPWTVWSRC